LHHGKTDLEQGGISMTKTIPEGFHSVTPMVMFKDARKAIDFYRRAFGAKERFIMPGPDGTGVMHAESSLPPMRARVTQRQDRSRSRPPLRPNLPVANGLKKENNMGRMIVNKVVYALL
jgi:hypothetical protein